MESESREGGNQSGLGVRAYPIVTYTPGPKTILFFLHGVIRFVAPSSVGCSIVLWSLSGFDVR